MRGLLNLTISTPYSHTLIIQQKELIPLCITFINLFPEDAAEQYRSPQQILDRHP